MHKYFRAVQLIWRCDPKGMSSYFAVVAIASLSAPVHIWLSKLLIDKVLWIVQHRNATDSGALRSVTVLLVAQVVLWIANGILAQTTSVAGRDQATKLSYYIDRLILQKVVELDLSTMESNIFAEQRQRVRDNSSGSCRSFLSFHAALIHDMLSLCCMVYFVSRLHPLAMIFISVLSIPNLYTTTRISRQRYRAIERRSPNLAMVNYIHHLIGSRESAKELKLYALQGTLFKRLDRLWAEFLAENRDLSRRERWAEILVLFLSGLGTAGVWVYAIFQATAARISVGDLVLFLQAAKSASDILARLSASAGNFYESSLFLTDLFTFLDSKTSTSNRGPAYGPRNRNVSTATALTRGIEFRNVSFRYPGSRTDALKNISFTIRPEERVAIVGENGAGKTTIIKLITRLYAPTSGTILLDGHPIDEYDLGELRTLFGVLFQDFVRYELTVRDNIAFGNVSQIDNTERLRNAAHLAGCLHEIEQLASGFNTCLGHALAGGVDLSGGIWQRIALARTYMRDARILVLDEPTSALDPLAEEGIIGSLEKFMKSRTCIIVSHRFSTVLLMDRILLIDYGSLVECGSHGELMALDRKYARMYRAQSTRYTQACTRGGLRVP
jgi:ATP-binding cassette subfamily B protein